MKSTKDPAHAELEKQLDTLRKYHEALINLMVDVGDVFPFSDKKKIERHASALILVIAEDLRITYNRLNPETPVTRHMLESYENGDTIYFDEVEAMVGEWQLNI
jgi:hypothetical protein